MGGSSNPNQVAVDGETANSKSDSSPGARESPLSLYDSCTHTFILFGGNGYDSVTLGKYFTKSTHC